MGPTRTGSSIARINAAQTVEYFEQFDAPSIPLLIAALNDDDWLIRRTETVAPNGERAIPRLKRLLATASTDVIRYGTISALGSFGEDANAALPELISVLQDSRAMAVLGTLGGFLAPILASTASGNHVALFTYYLVLNAAIFVIAYFKIWRQLNLLRSEFFLP